MARLPLILILAAASVGTVVIAPTPADAQQRVVVQNFRGPRAPAVRADAVRGLRGQSVAVVPRSQLARAARRMRLRMRRDRDYARAGRAISADLFVEGRVRRRRGWHLSLTVREGGSGAVVSRATISGRNPRALGNRVRSEFWAQIAPALDGGASGGAGGGASGPAMASADDDMVFSLADAEPSDAVDLESMENEAPPPVEEREQTVEEELEDIRRRNLDGELFPTGAPQQGMDDEVVPGLQRSAPFQPAHSPVEARVGLALMNRSFNYQNDLSGATRPYTLPLGAALGFGAAYYPGAHFSNGPLAHIGLTLDASHSVGMSTQGPNEVVYPTKDTRWGIGLRGRLPLGESEVGLSLGWARHSFTVTSEPGAGSPDIASVSYGQIRIGADTRVQLGNVRLYGAAAYRPVVDTGEISDSIWYPGTSAQGFSVDLGVGYVLPLGFEVRADLGAEMYFLDFHASPDDPMAVGGATDRYLGGNLGVVWHMSPTGI